MGKIRTGHHARDCTRFRAVRLLARLTRASLLQVLNEIIPGPRVPKGPGAGWVVHAMKNAMIPVVTIIGPLFAF